ncbi:unnamed protein product [Caenorhabditis brenneri]
MPGKRFLVAHVDLHRDRIGEIVTRLVTEFGVTASVCNDIQVFCPKCSDSPGAKSDHNHDDHSKLTDNHQKRLPKVFPKNVSTQAIPHRVAPATKTAKGVIAKRKGSPKNVNPEVKKAKIDPPLKNDEIYDLSKFVQKGNDMRSNNSGGGSQQPKAQMSKRIDPPMLTVKGKPRNERGESNNSGGGSQQSTAQMSKRIVPPILTVNEKTSRGRIIYTSHELEILEKYYNEDPNASADPKKREGMCKALPRHDSIKLKNWFKHRRRKDRKKKPTDDSRNQQA